MKCLRILLGPVLLFAGSGAAQNLLRTLADPAPNPAPFFVRFPGGMDTADVNGDGTRDFLIGAPREAPVAAAGQVIVYDGLTGAVLYAVTNPAPATAPGLAVDRFGDSVACLGDLDGDGRDDFAAGAPNVTTSPLGLVAATGVRAFSGATGAQLWHFDGGTGNATGRALVRLPDRDGDGRDDVGVVADAYVAILSGATGAVFQILAIPDLGPFGIFASQTAAVIGDVTGDGHAEVAVGGRTGPDALANAGRIIVFDGFTGAPVFLFVGADIERLGASLAAVGDVDGDSFPDLIAGAPGGQSLVAVDTGEVRILRGAGAAAPFAVISPPAGTQQFGATVAATLDLDGDGISEVAVGTTGLLATARIYSIAGGVPALLYEIQDPLALSPISRIQGAADLDGDGTRDILAGAGDRVLVFGTHLTPHLSLGAALAPGGVSNLALEGRPLTPVALAADLAAGGFDAGTFGIFALSFTPALTILVDGSGLLAPPGDPAARVPAAGPYRLWFAVPSSPVIAGLTLHVQGVVFDGFQVPGLYSISNPLSLTF